ncbi:hypothetical protein J4210_01425 [Candidatus Woesearchaeota archaeon]|nr:hypothetical protein [Candidatus Woesearchaeota archaeon]
MKKLMLLSVVLISVLFVVAGCQPADDAEALAGQAIKSDVLKCGKNAECNVLAKKCILAEKCTETANACKSQCGNDRKCTAACAKTQASCANPCYDTALAATLNKPVAASCVDSDAVGGSDGHDAKAYKMQGYVKDKSVNLNTAAKYANVVGDQIKDKCNPDGKLVEQLCSGGFWEPETIDCVSEVGPGSECFAGACVTCEDKVVCTVKKSWDNTMQKMVTTHVYANNTNTCDPLGEQGTLCGSTEDTCAPGSGCKTSIPTPVGNTSAGGNSSGGNASQ